MKRSVATLQGAGGGEQGEGVRKGEPLLPQWKCEGGGLLANEGWGAGGGGVTSEYARDVFDCSALAKKGGR